MILFLILKFFLCFKKHFYYLSNITAGAFVHHARIWNIGSKLEVHTPALGAFSRSLNDSRHNSEYRQLLYIFIPSSQLGLCTLQLITSEVALEEGTSLLGQLYNIWGVISEDSTYNLFFYFFQWFFKDLIGCFKFLPAEIPRELFASCIGYWLP